MRRLFFLAAVLSKDRRHLFKTGWAKTGYQLRATSKRRLHVFISADYLRKLDQGHFLGSSPINKIRIQSLFTPFFKTKQNNCICSSLTWPEQWRKITHIVTWALSNPIKNVSININNLMDPACFNPGVNTSAYLQQPTILANEENVSKWSLWSEVCEKQKMPLWVSVYSSAFRYQKQACYGEGSAVCQTVVSKKDQWGGLLLKSLLSLSSYKLSFHFRLHNRQWKHWQVGWLRNDSSRNTREYAGFLCAKIDRLQYIYFRSHTKA